LFSSFGILLDLCGDIELADLVFLTRGIMQRQTQNAKKEKQYSG
jgi:hypothetical protein